MTKQLPWKHVNRSHLPGWALLLLLCLGGITSLNAQLSVSFSVTEPICFGLPNGSVTATASGGTPDYVYQWSTGDTGATLSGITAGTYTLTVTDALNQSITSSVTVNQPDLVTVTLTADELCNAPFNITANPDGGIAP